MPTSLRIALVGDYNPSVIAHQAIPEAIRLSADTLGYPAEAVWIHTASISNSEASLRDFDGIWCVPASPYASMEGALQAIQYAREFQRPYLGTCAGFQHALLEYARNVAGCAEASHAEVDATASLQLISPLSCALTGDAKEVILQQGTLIQRAYGATRITEEYNCSYGLNPEYEKLVLSNDLRPTAHDALGQVRAVELLGHPFFVATLFQPERRTLRGEVPPLVTAFVKAVRKHASSVVSV